MMAKNIPKMPLPKLDDLFTTEEERTNNKLEKVIDIKIYEMVSGHRRKYCISR